jgi:hypothetical protein
MAAKSNQKHGKIVHRLNEREAVVWDATDISPEVAERFDRVLAHRIVANNKILKKLGLAKDTTPELDNPSAGRTV